MELMKETATVEDIVCAEQTQIMVDSDIIVPDVKPDVLKILQVDADAIVTKKDTVDGKLCVEGDVHLKILYIPDCREGGLKSICTSCPFTYKLERTGIEAGMCAAVDADAKRVEFRLINSRKLGVKAIVGLDLCVCTTKELELVTGVADEAAQVMRTPITVAALAADCERELIVKESVEIPAGKCSITEILKIDAKISDKAIKAVTGKALVQGTVGASILYTGDNNALEFAEFELPFTEVFDVADLSESSGCEIDYAIRDMYFETQEDSDGDIRVINLEFIVGAHIKAADRVEMEIVEDCYMPRLKTELVRADTAVDEVICTPSVQNTIREIVSIDNAAPQIASVYHVVTKADITNTSVENNKIFVEGVIDACVLYLTESAEMPVYSYQKQIPFSYSIESDGAKNGMDCDVKAEVEHTGYSLNVANEVELRMILSIRAKVIQKHEMALIREMNVTDEDESTKNGIIIYFVQNGDRMWDVAKRYRASIDEIVECNDISPEEKLCSGMQLIIPTGK